MDGFVHLFCFMSLDMSAPFSLCSPQRHQQKLTVSDNG